MDPGRSRSLQQRTDQVAILPGQQGKATIKYIRFCELDKTLPIIGFSCWVLFPSPAPFFDSAEFLAQCNGWWRV
jgi:hypothetical protein